MAAEERTMAKEEREKIEKRVRKKHHRDAQMHISQHNAFHIHLARKPGKGTQRKAVIITSGRQESNSQAIELL